jgi:hypothetical protein
MNGSVHESDESRWGRRSYRAALSPRAVPRNAWSNHPRTPFVDAVMMAAGGRVPVCFKAAKKSCVMGDLADLTREPSWPAWKSSSAKGNKHGPNQAKNSMEGMVIRPRPRRFHPLGPAMPFLVRGVLLVICRAVVTCHRFQARQGPTAVGDAPPLLSAAHPGIPKTVPISPVKLL